MEVYASKTELTYLEVLRVFGFFCGTFFFGLLLFLLRKTAKLTQKDRWLFYSLIFLLLNCTVNPHLFASNGMIPLGLLLAIVGLQKGPMTIQKITLQPPHSAIISIHRDMN